MERPSSVASPKFDHIWVLHHDQNNTDLLVVRVTTEGEVLPATVLFASSDWKSRDFQRIMKSETARMPKPEDMTIGFKDEPSRSILHNYVSPPTVGDAELQFCAVLPLTQNPLAKPASARSYLEPLVQLLGLSNLVREALRANEQWCYEQCQLKREEYGSMILCDSTKCKVGWYHNRCVQLDENHTASEWFCNDCIETGDVSLSEYDNEQFEDYIIEASDRRIWCARSLDQVWKYHKWPKPTEVLNLMDCEISFEIERNVYKNAIKCLENQKSVAMQCWAIPKNNLKQITPMLSTNRHSPRIRAQLLKD